MAKREIPKVKVQARERLGKRYSARLRKGGRLPAVIYGHKLEPAHVSMDRIEMTDLLHGNVHLLEVALDAHTEPCLIKDIQWNHLGNEVVHVDLERVDLNERVTVTVPLELVGEAAGLKEAGTILEHFVNEVEVECLATDIPDSVRVDVSGLGVGDSITGKDVKLPEGVKANLDEDTIVAAVHTLKEEAEAPAAVAEGGVEPEVITKGKEEEGAGGEGAAAAKK